MAKSRFQQDLVVTGAIAVGGSPDAKSVLDLTSTTKGALLPRMTTTQRDAIATPPQGLIIFNTTTNKLNTYNMITWVEVGSGSGQGGINYISANNGNADFETDTAGYVEYADSPGDRPVDGDGGSPTVAISRTTSSPLRGDGSGLITKDAADRQGEGISYDFAISRADRSKPLAIEFEYEVSANFVSGDNSDIVVYILPLDGSDTALKQPTPYTIQGRSNKFSALIQATSDADNYRITWHIATTNALAWTFKFDSVYVGPDSTKALLGAPITDWKEYPSALSFDNLPTSSAFGFWRQVGDTMECEVYAVASGAATGVIGIPLPSNAIDFDKLPYDISAIGMARANSSGNIYGGPITTLTGDPNHVGIAGPNNQGDWQAAVPFTWGAGDTITAFFRVPILGWSSNVLMSNDTDTRVIAAKYVGAGGADIALTGNVSNYQFDTKEFDKSGMITTGSGFKITAPVAGVYKIKGQIYQTVTNTDVYWWKNGVSLPSVAGNFLAGTGTNKFEGVFELNAGDYLQLRPQGSVTQSDNSSYNWISVERISGPATIALSEKVKCLYLNTAGTAVGNSNDLLEYADKLFDSHGCYASGIFTAPRADTYAFVVTGYTQSSMNSSTSWFLRGYKNNTDIYGFDNKAGTGAPNTSHTVKICGIIDLDAGETFQVKTGLDTATSINLDTTAGANSLSIWSI
jgi:hypothetical protein